MTQLYQWLHAGLSFLLHHLALAITPLEQAEDGLHRIGTLLLLQSFVLGEFRELSVLQLLDVQPAFHQL